MSKMSNAPVFYAMAQVHFAPIAVANYNSFFHDAVRAKFPLKSASVVRRLELTQSANVPTAQINDSTLWFLTAADEHSGLILDDSTLTYHTTRYDTKMPFIDELLEALDHLHKIAKLDHLSRLGMRYLDAVFPKVNQSIGKYLETFVHGVSKPSLERNQAMSESIFRTQCSPLIEEGTLVSRVYQLHGKLQFPPELLPTRNLKLLNKFEEQETDLYAIIDTDHFCEGMMPMELGGAKSQLESLHQGCSDIFRAVTTKFAQDCWE
jgi:uncharacterized protein (TIGR04255 family)